MLKVPQSYGKKDENQITDVWQSEISNVFLKANYDRQTGGEADGQKKRLIGAQAFALPKDIVFTN